MSNWKVSREKIEIFEHPNAEKLALGKVGTYQVVVQKGLYNGGEDVVFAPEKSILTGKLEQEYKNYLAGPDKNRVRAVALRGSLSCGIIIPNELVKEISGKEISELPTSEDISQILGIVKYEAPIPTNLAGEVERIENTPHVGKHDCEQFGVYASNFTDKERVVVTEKIHGSQFVGYYDVNTQYKFIASKGLMGNGLCLKETEGNAYWRAANEIGLWDKIAAMYPATVVQIFGELVPCQGANWSYGFAKPTIRIFDVRMNGTSVPYDLVSENLKPYWVPVIFDGEYDAVKIREFCVGKEQLSGKELHIREGVVVRPYLDRYATDGTKLRVKIINPAYKETGEEIN